jgi:hypothetical protein
MMADNPVSCYYLKLDDLSINLTIALKWIFWGYKFISATSRELINLDSSEYSFKSVISTSLQVNDLANLNEKPHVITINDCLVHNREEFNKIVDRYCENGFFLENNKIHLKLKVNIREFLILDHVLFPTFLKQE